MEEDLQAMRARGQEMKAALHDVELEIDNLEQRREGLRLELAFVNGQIEGYVAAMRSLVSSSSSPAEDAPPAKEPEPEEE